MLANRNRVIASIRADCRVYPSTTLSTGGPASSVLNTNGQPAKGVNAKVRSQFLTAQQNEGESSDILMTNNRLQASVMDLGKKLLQYARENDISGVEGMMTKGAPFASDWLGMTAIHFAAMNNRYDICKLLCTSGINKDARTKVDRTPLHLAAFYGHERIVQLLIEHQCSLNPRDMLRMTPLHWAVEKRHKEIVRILLKHNADVTAISKFGKTPIALAVLTEQADILEELENARQLQQSKKFNEQNEKETNEAVNSIMGESKHEDEPAGKKFKRNSEGDKPIKNNFRISADPLSTLEDSKETKVHNNSAVNLLKSHGITIMKDDEDTSNKLLTTALQNGRQLVLSEGGKLLLNEAKKMGGNQVSEAVKVVPSHQTNTVASVKIKTEPQITKFRPNIMPKPKNVTPAKDVSAKNIRIISLNDFKKIYGNGNLKTMQNSLNKSEVVKMKSNSKTYSPKIPIEEYKQEPSEIVYQEESVFPFEEEESDLPPNIIKVSTESEQEDSSDFEAMQTAIIHPPAQLSTAPQIQPPSNSNTTRITYTRSPNKANTLQDRTPVIPLLTIPEICRQLLELRKQNEELRRKYEIAQKEKEDFRNRLERLESLLVEEQNVIDYSEI